MPASRVEYVTVRWPPESLITSGPSSFIRLLRWNPDLIYIHRTDNLAFMAARLAQLRPTFLDAHSSTVMELRAFGRNDQARRSAWREGLGLWAAQGVIAASRELMEFLAAEYGLNRSSCWTVPNGVPESTLARPPGGIGWRRRLALADTELLVLHSAPAGFEANDLSLNLVEHIAQATTSIFPRICIVVTGRFDAPAGTRALGVVEDYLDLVDASDVAMVPFPPEAVCGGARNKVLEFFARGKAVISTREGMRGVENAKPSEHYIHAETPKEFYDALLLLRDDVDLRIRLGRAARAIAKDYLWSSAARRLLGIFRSVV